MPRFPILLLAMAALSVSAATSVAQAPVEAAPIERSTAYARSSPYAGAPHADRRFAATPVSQPVQGVQLRVSPNGSVTTLSSDAKRTELRLDRGIANISIHDPAKDTVILVDLPGGQVQPLKNGFYTFNAATGTVRVLRGEASAFPGQTLKPIKVKEDHQLAFTGSNIRSTDADPNETRADILPGAFPGNRDGRHEDGFNGGYPYDYGEPYAAFGYGYPYPYGFGYPYGPFGYPYGFGYGYPFGFGLGFGYYGGFGYRGGFRGYRR